MAKLRSNHLWKPDLPRLFGWNRLKFWTFSVMSYRVFFYWSAQKTTKCQTLRKFWHLELFRWDFLCNLTLRTFRGGPVKKPPYRLKGQSQKAWIKDGWTISQGYPTPYYLFSLLGTFLCISKVSSIICNRFLQLFFRKGIEIGGFLNHSIRSHFLPLIKRVDLWCFVTINISSKVRKSNLCMIQNEQTTLA